MQLQAVGDHLSAVWARLLATSLVLRHPHGGSAAGASNAAPIAAAIRFQSAPSHLRELTLRLGPHPRRAPELCRRLLQTWSDHMRLLALRDAGPQQLCVALAVACLAPVQGGGGGGGAFSGGPMVLMDPAEVHWLG